MTNKEQITIIGCGVIGMSAGIRLLEAGYKVQIVARDLPPNTTSNWAAAMWFPYRVYPYDRVLSWGATTYDVLQSFLDVPETGVRNLLLTLITPEPPVVPWWGASVPAYHHATADELPAGYQHGYSLTVPVCDTGMYLDYLLNWYRRLGGMIEQREVGSFEEVIRPKSTIINCTGLGAHTLANDKTLYPIRGQIVKVRQPAVVNSIIRDFEDGQHPAYIIPRIDDIILGGTTQINNWDETVDPEITQHILKETAKLMPALADAEIISQGAGLRPGRPSVRLEAEHLADDCVVIHSYGHGGAGITLSWGCAAEVVRMVQERLTLQT
ncbi:MAG: FAD-dependent oxidoreductase [Candidatus Promineifilaceae bacterium]